MRSTRLPAILIASLLMLSIAPGAPAESSVTGRRVCVFTIQNLTPEGAHAEYETGITETVEQELEGAGARILRSGAWGKAPRMPRDPRDLLLGPVALAVAEDVGAELAVNGSYTVEGEEILVSLQCWDVAARAPLSGFLRVWRFNLAFYNSLHEEIVSRLVPRIAFRDDGGQVPTGSPEPIPARARTEIQFLSAQEGMQVFIEGDAPAGIIENGRLTWPAGVLPEGTKLRVQKKLDGFHTGWQDIRVQPQVALSPLTRTATEAVEINWTLGQLLGLGATLRGYWSPDALYRWYSSYLSIQIPTTSAGRPVFHYDTGMGIGAYVFFPPGSPVRLALSTGVGAVFSIRAAQGAQMYTDFYLDLLNWAVEARVWGVTAYVRQEMKFATGFADNLLGTSWMFVSGSFPPITIGVLLRR